MEIVGLMLIALAFIILAFSSKDDLYKILYLGASLLFIVISARLIMLGSSIAYLNQVYLIAIWTFLIFILVLFIFIFKDIFLRFIKMARVGRI